MRSNPTNSESQCSCAVLRKATRRITQLYDAALAPSGLRATQHAILAQIGRSAPASMGALAQSLVMDAGALAHTLKPLERDGYVTVEVDPRDRRNRRISLTAAGRAKLVQMEALWERAQAGFDHAFGTAASRALRQTLSLLTSETFAQRFDEGLSVASRRRPAGGRKASP